jgi:hypothetical protein
VHIRSQLPDSSHHLILKQNNAFITPSCYMLLSSYITLLNDISTRAGNVVLMQMLNIGSHDFSLYLQTFTVLLISILIPFNRKDESVFSDPTYNVSVLFGKRDEVSSLTDQAYGFNVYLNMHTLTTLWNIVIAATPASLCTSTY